METVSDDENSHSKQGKNPRSSQKSTGCVLKARIEQQQQQDCKFTVMLAAL